MLEALHAFGLVFYPDAETRRSLLRLAYAHGVLLGLVNLAFAATLPHTRQEARRRVELASTCLESGSFLLPAGLFMVGASAHAGDPARPSCSSSPGRCSSCSRAGSWRVL